MMRPRVRIGRLLIYLWSGSWSWVERLDCPDHCRNVYIGPFGFEWLLKVKHPGPSALDQHKAALNVALAYAEGRLPLGTPESEQELAGCRLVLRTPTRCAAACTCGPLDLSP